MFDNSEIIRFHSLRNFGNFLKYFHHNFRLNGKIQILMASSERSYSDLSESTPIQN